MDERREGHGGGTDGRKEKGWRGGGGKEMNAVFYQRA